MFGVHQKLYLQNQDVKYLQRQVFRAAKSKLDLHLPSIKDNNNNNNKVGKKTKKKIKPAQQRSKAKSKAKSTHSTSRRRTRSSTHAGDDKEDEEDEEEELEEEEEEDDDDDEEEEDVVRLKVKALVDRYIHEAFELTKYSLVVDDKELGNTDSLKELLHGPDSDSDSDETNTNNGKKGGRGKTKNGKRGNHKVKAVEERVEIEPFDFGLNDKLRKVYYQVEELTTQLTKKRAEVPIDLKGKFEAIAQNNLANIDALDKQIEEEAAADEEESEQDIISDKDKDQDKKETVTTTKGGILSLSDEQKHDLLQDYESSLIILQELKQNLPQRKDDISKLDDLVKFIQSRNTAD